MSPTFIQSDIIRLIMKAPYSPQLLFPHDSTASSNEQLNTSPFHIFSFFSGCGFLDLGFETSGFAIDLVNEFSSSFMKAYQYARKNMNIGKPIFGYSNIDVNAYLYERADELRNNIQLIHNHHKYVGFIGGPPCPDFSVAGKQKGKDGKNGILSQIYTQLIVNQQPDFFLFENVKGLWKTAKHRAFYEELKEILNRAGYVMTERLCNALEFAVPQDRDRIILFGIKKNLINSPSNVLDNFPWERYILYAFPQVKTLPWVERNPFEENSVLKRPDDIPLELTVQYWFDKNDVDNHFNAKECFIPRQGLRKMQIVDEGDVSRKSHKRLHRWRYSPTVAYGNNEVHLHPYKPRRLTVAEALALQSLPREFILPHEMTLTDKFKTIGNGVPYLMAKGIAQTIYYYLTEQIQNGTIHGI